MALNRVIGSDNGIPWHLPEDLKWFKKKTEGQIVVMGRKTYESLGRPLPNRYNIVVSRSGKNIEGVEVVDSLEAIEDLELPDDREIWICGGAEIYSQSLDHCSDIFLTLVKREFQGDTFFPDFEDRFVQKEILRDSDAFSTIHYVKKMKTFRRELWFAVRQRRELINITPDVEACLTESKIKEGLCLVNAMHISASVFINDDESGLHQDFERWLERLAPEKPHDQYAHNRGEDNADAHLKRTIMGREVVVAVTKGKLDFGPWEQIFYGEFDGKRRKRVLVKIIGE